MYGDQVSELLLGGKKSDIFLTSTLTWLKLFPLTMLHYNFFDSRDLFAVTLYVSVLW